MPRRKPVIGLALGSGSARGWSHIGIIRVLEQAGIAPDIVCGTSIGSLVGAAYADGQLERLEDWVRGLTWKNVLSLLDFKLSGGLLQGAKLSAFLQKHFTDKDIRELPKTFAAVATELVSGREIWLRKGSVIEAVRASIALPGLFTPAPVDGRLLVDGALVNPIPVSLCRAMGADLVIAVDLNWDLVGWHSEPVIEPEPEPKPRQPGALSTILERLPLGLGRLKSGPHEESAEEPEMPSILDVLNISLNIMQVRITRSRLAGEPADVIIRPRLADMALMDYHRASDAIAEGERAAELALAEIQLMIGSGLPQDSTP
jgi:NTE family protein